MLFSASVPPASTVPVLAPSVAWTRPPFGPAVAPWPVTQKRVPSAVTAPRTFSCVNEVPSVVEVSTTPAASTRATTRGTDVKVAPGTAE